MELTILDKSKGKLQFELVGANNTLCQAIKDELWNDKSVTVATFRIHHPLRAVPKFLIEADDPIKALTDASGRLQKKNAALKL